MTFLYIHCHAIHLNQLILWSTKPTETTFVESKINHYKLLYFLFLTHCSKQHGRQLAYDILEFRLASMAFADRARVRPMAQTCCGHSQRYFRPHWVWVSCYTMTSTYWI